MDEPSRKHTSKNKKYEVKPKDRWNNVTDLKYRMNGLLKYQLDTMVNNVVYDFDCVLIIDGEIEGSGKSTFAQQVAYYLGWKLGKKLTIDNIVFTPSQFKKAVEEADKFTPIVWDEAFLGTNKMRVMSKQNQTITSMLQQIRQKNLFIVIVLPYFFDLNSYLAVPRSWFLLHVYLNTIEKNPEDLSKPMIERGYFKFYSRKKKKWLYFKGKKEYNYDVSKGSFIGMFPPTYTVDEAAYKEKKAKITDEDLEDEQQEENIYNLGDERYFMIQSLLREIPVPIIAKATNYKVGSIYNQRRELELKGILTK